MALFRECNQESDPATHHRKTFGFHLFHSIIRVIGEWKLYFGPVLFALRGSNRDPDVNGTKGHVVKVDLASL